MIDQKFLSRLHLAVRMWILHPRLDLGSGIGSIGLGSLSVDRSWAVMLDDSHATPPTIMTNPSLYQDP